MKFAVVHNGNHEGVINRFGQPCPERYSLKHVNMVTESLKAAGHEVKIIEGDKTMLAQLEDFMPPAAGTRAPTGMVFNMAYGIQGDARYTHVPAALEMAGIPYTGSTPLGHALALDKVVTKVLMQSVGVPTPAFRVMYGPSDSDAGLNYPLVVKPRHESTSYGLQLVHDRQQLNAAVAAIVEKYQQSALVEEYIDGREVAIGLLGNPGNMEFLWPVELDFGNRVLRLVTWEDKYHKRVDEPTKICPAPLDPALLEKCNEISLGTFEATHLRDYARVDIRIDPQGRPFVLEINSMASLGDGGSYMTSAKAMGYDFATFVNRIVNVTHRRYFGHDIPTTSGTSRQAS
jgi:D-alanine-D-alanine ligase